jgi:drug/metabolite transporter (DMT)-like permease
MDALTASLMLALGTAAGAGFADYLGAHAARRMPAVRVAAWVQAFGLLVVLAALLLSGSGLPAFTLREAIAPVLGGLSIAVGLASLYRALAIGPIGVTAPTAAVVGAALPVVVAVGLGEALGRLQYLGLGLGLVGVALFASGPVGRSADDKLRGFGFALLAGLGIGGFTLALDASDPAAGLWPLLIARSIAAASLWVVAAAPAAVAAPGHWRRLAAASALDGAAMIAFVLALHAGSMAIVSVIAAMYPAFAVALATLIDRERLQRPQLAGLAFAAAAVVFFSLSG